MSDNKVHSKLGASSFHRVAACPGSTKESEGIEGTTSKAAEEGTLAHLLAEQWLSTGKKPKFEDREMEAHISGYVNSVLLEVELCGAVLNETFFVELKVDLHHIDKSMFGTSDICIYDKKNKELIVIDLKYGAGIFVDVRDNIQLKYYCLGAARKLKLPIKKYTYVVYQPRIDNSDGIERRETISVKEMNYYEAWVSRAVAAAKDPKAPLKAGKHCHFCPALPVCPEVEKQKKAIVKMEFKDEIAYKPMDLKKALDSIPVLKDWIKSVDEFAYKKACAGEKIPGYKLVEKKATRKWVSEDLVRDFIAGGEDTEEFYIKKLKSPAQVEKLVGKKEMPGFDEFIIKQSTGTVLVGEDDRRKEYIKQTAQDDFKELL